MALLQKHLAKFPNGGSRSTIIRILTNGNPYSHQKHPPPIPTAFVSSPKTSATHTNGNRALTNGNQRLK